MDDKDYRATPRLLLEKEVYTDVNKLILEKLGVSFDVEKMTEEIISELYEEFPYSKKETDENGVRIIKGGFYKTFFGDSYLIDFTCYNFKSIKDAEYYGTKFKDKYPMDSELTYATAVITLNLYAVCGTILNETSSSITHELMHAYELMKRNFNPPSSPRGAAGLYGRITKVMGESNDQCFNEFLDALYVSFEHEQVAFTNQYADLLKHSNNVYYYYQRFDPYIKLLNLKNVLNNFDKYRGYCEGLRITEDWAYKFLENGYKTYLYKLSRVIYKYVVEVKEGTLRTRHNSGTIHVI